MSVYTAVDKAELNHFLSAYPVGTLRQVQGIAAGLANSNYRIDTERGRYVLTLFEEHSGAAIAPLLALSNHLQRGGLPCPRPLRNQHGRHWQALHGRPAALAEWLPGHSPEHPGPRHCRQIGRALARLHTIGQHFRGPLPHGWGGDWQPQQARTLSPQLDAPQRLLLQRELTQLPTLALHQLPTGVIHSDLFRDNSLFQHGRLTGLLDLYDACRGPLLYDLAVTVNDWCSRPDGSLHQARLQALLNGYRHDRELTRHEHQAWPKLLRIAALRFWTSRLQFRQLARQQSIGQGKDPKEFQRILQQRASAARHGDRMGL